MQDWPYGYKEIIMQYIKCVINNNKNKKNSTELWFTMRLPKNPNNNDESILQYERTTNKLFLAVNIDQRNRHLQANYKTFCIYVSAQEITLQIKICSHVEHITKIIQLLNFRQHALAMINRVSRTVVGKMWWVVQQLKLFLFSI